ncbi:MAG: geranylgeranylglycerol-phosphate geranylgeranyltransferase [Cytophagaceae bacterium]|nr:geranylgeranylglycerol-phosphate geranylgeranyltransferase [Cytophagaceae bacterium]MDW8456098.1 geranylgeranylglycerol-phosphate geranylgeranyltransferase [Cytophagaceae bacterium]
MARVYLFDYEHLWSSMISDTTFFLITFSTLFTAAAGYVINDYYDVKIDLINKPSRVIIGKVFSRRFALLLNFFLNLFACGCALLVSFRFFTFVSACIYLMWFYSNHLKRTAFIGNLAISTLTSCVLLVMMLHYQTNHYAAVCFMTPAFFISLIREIVKDMEDIEGDREHGCKTLPILIGEKKTKKILYTLVLLQLLVSSTLFYFLSCRLFYYNLFVPSSITVVVAILIYRARKSIDYKRVSMLCKLIMIAGLLGMLLL